MCNCNRSINQGASYSGRATSVPRSLARTPSVPTPTQQRLLQIEAVNRRNIQNATNHLNFQNGMSASRAEQERLRRLTVLRTLGHS